MSVIEIPVEYVAPKPVIPIDGPRSSGSRRREGGERRPSAVLRRRMRDLQAERGDLPSKIAAAMLAVEFDEVSRLQQRSVSGAIEFARVEVEYFAARRNELLADHTAARSSLPRLSERRAEIEARLRAVTAELAEHANEERDAAELVQTARTDMRQFDNKLAALTAVTTIVPWPVGAPLAVVAGTIGAGVHRDTARDELRRQRDEYRVRQQGTA